MVSKERAHTPLSYMVKELPKEALGEVTAGLDLHDDVGQDVKSAGDCCQDPDRGTTVIIADEIGRRHVAAGLAQLAHAVAEKIDG
jgi:hypothetical protein